MTYDPQRHHRRSIRLQGYDYTQPGAYFVTLVTYNRACLFGDIVDGEMRLNDAGRIAEQCWLDIPSHFLDVELDAFVIMPNHVHGILRIVGETVTVGAQNVSSAGAVGAKNFSPLPPSPPPSQLPSPPNADSFPHGTSRTIGSVVRGFKIGVTKWFRQNTAIYTVWQRNYYEHIIRSDRELEHIRAYIESNPQHWAADVENPSQSKNR
jgi:REP element-mobilizing transposase RayT